MNSAVQIFALLAGVLHVVIFLMESLWFMRPNVYLRFGADNAIEAEAIRLFAFNQGFYNLFLAVGLFVGLGLLHFSGNFVVAQTLILFSCASMLGAAVVLFFSAGKKVLRGAFIQGVFPMLAWLSWLMF